MPVSDGKTPLLKTGTSMNSIQSIWMDSAQIFIKISIFCVVSVDKTTNVCDVKGTRKSYLILLSENSEISSNKSVFQHNNAS